MSTPADRLTTALIALNKLVKPKQFPLGFLETSRHCFRSGKKRSLSKWQKAIVQGLLITSPLWGVIRPVVAAPAPPGNIDNTATGSFLDTSTNSTIEIFSNTVTVTVVEVAGITVTAQTPVEATFAEAEALLGVGNAGPYQNNTGVQTGDVVFFDFVITNVGNDTTEFVLPTVPSTVTGGTFLTGNMQVIEVDPGNGALADISSATPVTVTPSDANGDTTDSTSTTDLLSTTAFPSGTAGIIPPDGTITVRVPVQVTSTDFTTPGTVSVVLGETTPALSQNQDAPTPGANDVYTQDLADSTANPYSTPVNTTPEATGAPVSEKEASDQGSVTLTPITGDYGDAPDSYGTTLAEGGPVHSPIGTPDNLKIGATAPDSENDGQLGGDAGAGANEDDDTGTNDEDVVPTNLSISASSYSLTFNVTNNTGSGAYLVGWIDFDQSGTFDDDEGVIYDSIPGTPGVDDPIGTNASSQSITLTWDSTETPGIADLSSANASNPTYMRLRLSTDALTNTNQTGSATDGEVEDHQITLEAIDYGDAPDSYGTTSANTGASHTINSALYIGSTAPDAEPDAATPLTGTGDDATGTDDEQDFTFPALTDGDSSYSLTVPVNNTIAPATSANLFGWIDFDQNGTFEADEAATIAVPNGATSVTLNWTSTPGITAGATYIRLRLAETIANTDFNGPLGDGEVEDHPLTIDLYTVPPGGPNLTCDPTFYVVIGSGGATGTSTVKTVTRSGSTYSFPNFTNPTSNFTINALGYNPEDNYLYTMVVDSTNPDFPQGAVVRIDANGDLSNLGVPTQAATDGDDGVTLTSTLTGPNKTMNQLLPGSNPSITDTNFVNVLARSVQLPGGAFLAYGANAGTYVISTAPVSSNNYTPIFFIDVTNPGGPTFDFKGVVQAYINDFFVNPQDPTNDRLYAVDESPTGNNQLVYFDPTSPSTIPTVVYPDLGSAVPDGTNAGSQYADSFGTIYSRAAATGSGTFYGIDPSGIAQILTTTDAGGQHDGTSCPTVQMEKKPNIRSVTAGNTVTYTYRIANGRDVPLTVNFTDNLSSVTDYTPTTADESATPISGTFANGTINVAAPATSGTPVLSNSDRTLTIPNLVLPARSITTITANVVVPSSAPTNTYYNQSRLSNVNATDPDLPATVLSDDPGDSFSGSDQVFKNFGDPTYLDVTAASSTTPDLLLVKRITRLIPGDGSPDVVYGDFVNDGEDRNGDAVVDNNDPGWPANYITGVIGLSNTGNDQIVEASPGDIVEYTIYFLNTGDGAAENVRICDLLDPYLDYRTNTYTGLTPTDGGLSTTDLGIQLTIGSNPFYLTGINDPPDRGQFVTAGTAPANCIDPTDGLQATANDNDNGAIVVDITNANFIGTSDPTSETPNPFPALSNSTGLGTPNNSYGFIRFRVTVK